MLRASSGKHARLVGVCPAGGDSVSGGFGGAGGSADLFFLASPSCVLGHSTSGKIVPKSSYNKHLEFSRMSKTQKCSPLSHDTLVFGSPISSKFAFLRCSVFAGRVLFAFLHCSEKKFAQKSVQKSRFFNTNLSYNRDS